MKVENFYYAAFCTSTINKANKPNFPDVSGKIKLKWKSLKKEQRDTLK
jgi:hypothetical protein